jgi:hypothetical protein
MKPSRFFADEALGAGHVSRPAAQTHDIYLNEFVFRYNRRHYRQVSFETVLGRAAHRKPETYWNIIQRDNSRKSAVRIDLLHLGHT